MGLLTTHQTVDLRAHFDTITDPRHARGIRHPLTAMPTMAAPAVAAGARSITAI
ncbi:MAG TPA: transposase family protein [Pseudonocardiaceae bacterium]|nr:transposase family protein [Pseudonocardiaceae bacterium]